VTLSDVLFSQSASQRGSLPVERHALKTGLHRRLATHYVASTVGAPSDTSDLRAFTHCISTHTQTIGKLAASPTSANTCNTLQHDSTR
jgi:hypothetical protein